MAKSEEPSVVDRMLQEDLLREYSHPVSRSIRPEHAFFGVVLSALLLGLLLAAHAALPARRRVNPARAHPRLHRVAPSVAAPLRRLAPVSQLRPTSRLTSVRPMRPRDFVQSRATMVIPRVEARGPRSNPDDRPLGGAGRLWAGWVFIWRASKVQQAGLLPVLVRASNEVLSDRDRDPAKGLVELFHTGLRGLSAPCTEVRAAQRIYFELARFVGEAPRDPSTFGLAPCTP